MSNMDYNDPKDPNFRTRTTNYGSSWAWIAGAAAIVVVLFLIFGLVGTNTDTASNIPATTTGTPATTTGQAPRPMTPPATTGQTNPSAIPANPAGTNPQPQQQR